MEPVFFVFAFFAASYLILRQICLLTSGKVQTPTMTLAAGIASWFFILMTAAWILLALLLIYLMLFQGVFAAVVGLIFIILFSGLAFRFNELLDAGTVLYYLRDTALFRPMRPRVMLVQEELDKKEIHDVHRQTSNAPFPVQKTSKRVLTDEEIKQLHRDLHLQQKRPTRSNNFDEELSSLKSGAITSLTDPWKVYTFTRKLHDWYDEMSAVEINPSTKVLSFRVNVPGASEKALRNSKFVFGIKQELYQLFLVLNTDPWLAWYNPHVVSFSAILYGIESDSFGRTQLLPFMKVDIVRSVLKEREASFFNAADLHKISTIAFDNGNPLRDIAP